jgi:hypothetical protein
MMHSVPSSGKIMVYFLFIVFTGVGLLASGCTGKPDENATSSAIRATIEKPEKEIKAANEKHQKMLEATLESSSQTASKPEP